MSAPRDDDDNAPLLSANEYAGGSPSVGGAAGRSAAGKNARNANKEVPEAKVGLLGAEDHDDDDDDADAADTDNKPFALHARPVPGMTHSPPRTPRTPPRPPESAPSAGAGPSSAVPSRAGPSSTAAAPSTPDTSRCLICLEDYPPASFAGILRCAHPVCEPCLISLWEHAVTVDSEPFPRCPMPGCGSYASDATCASLLSPKTLRRLRQLRGLRPARAADGRRMYCDAPGCFEQLPPPPPPAPGADANEPEAPDANTSTCPACGATQCARCGGRGHPGTKCPVPLVCERQARMYRAYAVGRVSACPRCGVHVTRDGGCDQMSCARCRHTFTFAPFRSADEVAAAAIVDDESIPPPPVPTAWAAAFSQLFLAAYFMLWGTGFGALAFVTLVDALAKGSPSWDLLFLLPFVIFGVPSFVLGSLRFLVECARLVRHVGARADGSVYVACCMIVLSGVMLVLQAAVAHVAEGLVLWQYLMFFVPFIVCGAALLSIASAHLLLVGSRAAWGRWRGWRVGPSEGEGEGEAGAEVGEGERTGEEMV